MNILLNVTKSNFDVISNDVNVTTLHDVCARRNNVISRIAFIGIENKCYSYGKLKEKT